MCRDLNGLTSPPNLRRCEPIRCSVGGWAGCSVGRQLEVRPLKWGEMDSQVGKGLLCLVWLVGFLVCVAEEHLFVEKYISFEQRVQVFCFDVSFGFLEPGPCVHDDAFQHVERGMHQLMHLRFFERANLIVLCIPGCFLL